MLAVRATHVFDGEVFSHGGATVLCDDGRLVGVERGHPQLGPEWEVLDIPGGTVLPGLIDTHVHLVGDSGNGALDRVAGYTEDELDRVVTEGLRRQLAGGVTTVRDLGDRRWNVVDRRDRQRDRAAGSLADHPEPTILASGPPITSVSGHCHYLGGEVAGPSAIVAAVRDRAEREVDVIKVMASGGMTTPGTDVMHTQFTDDEMSLLVSTAHDLGLAVTAHAHGLPAVMQALAAGADGIEHCSCLTETGVSVSEELMKTLADRAIPIGAALGAPPVALIALAPPAIRQMMERAGLTPEMVRGLRLETVGRMYRAGARFVAGGDSGISTWMSHRGPAPLHRVPGRGRGHRCRRARLRHVVGGRRLPGRRSEGSAARPGFDADLAVVEGDLAASAALLENVRAVILAGRLVG